MDLLRIVVFAEPGQVEVREIAPPTLRPGQVLIESHLTAISAGTELLVLDGNLPGVLGGAMRYPLVPGYENVGRVVEVGGAVSGLREGDWVISEGSPSFPALHSCWGAHSELVAVPAENAFRLPDGLEPDGAVFMVMTSIALHALQRATVSLGDDVIVLGQGVLGLIAVQVARAMGARSVVAVDRLSSRLGISTELGATATVQAESLTEAGVKLAELSAGRGADVVVEASGSPELAGAASRIACERGRLVLAGMYTRPITFDYWDLYTRELDVLVSRQAGPKQELPDPYYRWTWRHTNEQSLQLLLAGQVQVMPLITHRLPVERIDQGYEAHRTHPEDTVKVLIEWR